MNSSYRQQNGSALFVALMLLLLLSVVVFFAVRTGLSEQRTSASDARAKIAHKIAEAGIDHGIEFLRLRGSTLLPLPEAAPDSTLWTLCASTDTGFPCGAEPNAARRGTMFAYTGGVDIIANGAAAAVDLRSLPTGQILDQVGNFPVTYNVGALLCLIDAATVGAGLTAACTLDNSRSTTNAVILVSTGQINNESARATISQAVGTFRILNNLPSLPPVVASGVLDGLGAGSIIGNPDSGGPGVPLATWTRVASSPGGSFRTCHADEYYRSDAGTTVSSSGVRLCPDCACPSSSRISDKDNEGEDMLDPDDTDGGILQGTSNYQFPCDLFRYVFGVAARTDSVSNSLDDPPLCETHSETGDLDGDGSVEPDVVEWLQLNATEIADCNSLKGNTSGGFYYTPNSCHLNDGADIGTSENPVTLVATAGFRINGPTFYGLIFIRDPATVLVGTGSGEWEAGGGASKVYGAVVIEGSIKAEGDFDIISSPQILRNIQNRPNNLRYGRVPGSWSDMLSY